MADSIWVAQPIRLQHLHQYASRILLMSFNPTQTSKNLAMYLRCRRTVLFWCKLEAACKWRNHCISLSLFAESLHSTCFQLCSKWLLLWFLQVPDNQGVAWEGTRGRRLHKQEISGNFLHLDSYKIRPIFFSRQNQARPAGRESILPNTGCPVKQLGSPTFLVGV